MLVVEKGNRAAAMAVLALTVDEIDEPLLGSADRVYPSGRFENSNRP